MDDTERERQQAVLERLERFSRFTDTSIGIPFTRFRFGFDAIIGLIPGIGDFAGLVLAGYVLYEAHRAGASPKVKRRMMRTMLIDFVGGLLPVVGDAFDAIYKANTRNTKLLKRHLREQLEGEAKETFPWWTLVWLSLLIGGLAWIVLRLV